ncbi:MAG TPA: hypothetical protein VMC06_02090, partial [Opitutaceae bacterium]|nr:hypothetical protein [Opitutaceae bacterium]
MTLNAKIILGGVFIVALIVAVVLPGTCWVSGFVLNVAAGVFGTFLTVTFIDSVLRKQEEERQ